LTNLAALTRLTAREAVALLRRRAVSPLEMLEASIARIGAVDGRVNALPVRCFERAREAAARIEATGGPDGGHPGFLAGLPIAIKDIDDVAGVVTTYGSPLYAENEARQSDPVVRRLEGRGGVVAAKSNTPELGMLPVTDNRLFGPTRNPYDLSRTPGGSSGGAAAALASGQVWLAHGTDIGGSLRIPAAFTGVVGFRPSPGVVPRAPQRRMFNPLAVEGPMARTVGDAALFLDAMAGLWPADPLTVPEPAISYQAAVDRARVPFRIAFAPDLGLGGVDAEVAEIVQAAVSKLERAGARVEVCRPGYAGVERAYRIIVAFAFLTQRGEFVEKNRERLEPHLSDLLDAAKGYSFDDLLWAERWRADHFNALADFLDTHELLVTPTLGVAAFGLNRRGPAATEVDGWLREGPPAWFHQCWATTLAGCPVLSVPCGFTRAGLPVGLQILGPPRSDVQVLAAGAVVESLVDCGTRVPIDPREPVVV
jgi:amidase